jgi:hypothetical protein
MNRKFLAIIAAGMVALPSMAQETYQSTKLVENELNGTARYVGMGGAMEALGADISTISTNPAGIGLFRRSQVTVSGGLVTQSDASTDFSFGSSNISIDGNKTNASFDQAGFVWAKPMGRSSYMNFAFNYHKSRNFDQILNAVGTLTNASQNKLSAIKLNKSLPDMAYNALDASYANLLGTVTNSDGTVSYDYLNGTGYAYGQYQKGYIGCYDFNFSGNINDRIFLGVTFGIHDVNYRSNSYYTEDLENSGISESWEKLKIDGTGYDIKFGAIFRPIEESPFRFGIYVSTPIFYDLTMHSASDVTMTGVDDQGQTIQGDQGQSADYDFKVYTPWKFGFSLGHTIGNYLALGATYEYSDYSGIDNRVNDGDYYNYWYDDWYSSSDPDDVMNDNTDYVLKGVHTVKLGLEVKPIPEFAIRAGYNYQSAIFDEDGYRDGSLDSPGVGYATSTDYTNWKDTNRFTFGLGYQIGKLNIDLAYQYTQTDGTFYPFMSYYDSASGTSSDYDCIATGSKVNFKRNQVLLTLGYKF